MNGFCRVIIAGNLTRDPELRYTPSGIAVAKFGVAVNRKWKDQSGQMKEEVTFVDVDAFGKQAEAIGQYLKKGRPILLEGRLKLSEWEDKQTHQKRSKLGVVLESFTFLDSGTREGGESAPTPRSQPAASASAPASSEAPEEDDGVPF